MKITNTRALAAKLLTHVLQDGRHLSDVLHTLDSKNIDPREARFIKELCYGVCRWYHRLEFILQQLLRKPLKEKDSDVFCLLLIGLYQLHYMRVPSHAAVNETVKAVTALKKPWARSVVNAVLRNYQRQASQLEEKITANAVAQYSHPAWLIKKIQANYPDDWQAIANANNQHAPMCLRVNRQKQSRDQYLQQLNEQNINATVNPISDCGIDLQNAVDVTMLPDFDKGNVTIQDTAAQLAASLLQVEAGHRVLDACAAPGGKTTHIAEIQPNLEELVALDNSAKRLEKLKNSCARVAVNPTIKQADANDLATWWDGQAFDRILLDAPCSASGVIRRRPDIKILRDENDIQALCQQQLQLLKTLWTTLKPGGLLLYATCSIFSVENQDVIDTFLQSQTDAEEQPIAADWGKAVKHGRQILPGQNNMDGFYYALLRKK